jgi:hypothetical protein
MVEEWCLLGCYAVWLLLRAEVSKELSASFIRVTRIGELGTTLAVTSNRRTLRQFLQEPHGVTFQKTPFFIVTAVKTSNLTLYGYYRMNIKSDLTLKFKFCNC